MGTETWAGFQFLLHCALCVGTRGHLATCSLEAPGVGEARKKPQQEDATLGPPPLPSEPLTVWSGLHVLEALLPGPDGANIGSLGWKDGQRPNG